MNIKCCSLFIFALLAAHFSSLPMDQKEGQEKNVAQAIVLASSQNNQAGQNQSDAAPMDVDSEPKSPMSPPKVKKVKTLGTDLGLGGENANQNESKENQERVQDVQNFIKTFNENLKALGDNLSPNKNDQIKTWTQYAIKLSEYSKFGRMYEKPDRLKLLDELSNKKYLKKFEDVLPSKIVKKYFTYLLLQACSINKWNQQLKIVKRVIHYFADIFADDNQPLFDLIQHKNNEAAIFLLDCMTADSIRNLPVRIMQAAFKAENKEMIRVLLDRGFIPSAMSSELIKLSLKEKDTTLLRFLLLQFNHKQKIELCVVKSDLIDFALKEKDNALLKLILFQLDEKEKAELSYILQDFIDSKDIEKIKLALDCGFDPNKGRNKEGINISPLLSLAKEISKEDVVIACMLLEAGADVSLVYKPGTDVLKSFVDGFIKYKNSGQWLPFNALIFTLCTFFYQNNYDLQCYLRKIIRQLINQKRDKLNEKERSLIDFQMTHLTQVHMKIAKLNQAKLYEQLCNLFGREIDKILYSRFQKTKSLHDATNIYLFARDADPLMMYLDNLDVPSAQPDLLNQLTYVRQMVAHFDHQLINALEKCITNIKALYAKRKETDTILSGEPQQKKARTA